MHVTASDGDGEDASNVNYDVSSDLTSGNIFVEVDASGAYPVSRVLALVAKPDLEKPLKQRADAAQARNDAIIAAQNARTPTSIDLTELPNDDYTTGSATATALCQRGKPFTGAPCAVVKRSIVKNEE